jgi:hypothetical protein
MSGNNGDTTGGGQAGPDTGANPTIQPTRPTPPDYVMDEVKLLLTQVTTPETNVTFNAQSSNVQSSRADAGTIKDTIHPGPAQAPKIVWTWENYYAREHQTLTDGDVGSIGYQVDIDSYFSLDNATGPVWSLQPNPDATSSPFELSTGASDAVAYHDFYRLQIAFEDVWAELIDTSITTAAQEFYAKWDALMNAGESSAINGEQYIDQFDALSSTLEAAQQAVSSVSSLINPTTISQFASSLNQLTSLLGNSISIVAQVQGNASDAFKIAFGPDLQKAQAELQTAVSGLIALFSGQPAAGAPATNALGAAIQIINNLKDELSQQGASARIATFNAIPPGSIGGYDELENFLNDVRIILGLPTIAPPLGSTDSADDYAPYFETIALNVKGAIDYLDCLVLSLLQGLQPAQTPLFSATINSSIINASSTILWLMKNTAEDFQKTYESDLNDINSSLSDATSRLQTLVLELVGDPSGVVKPLTPTDVNTPAGSPGLPSNIAVSGPDVRDSLNAASKSLDNLRFKYKPQSSSQGGDQSAATDLNFPEVETLFKELSDMLKERYKFDVFVPASINYGLLLNYRQKWQPQSYQVGNLVKTIPLGPGETRKYTTKTIVKKSRNAKELDDSLRSRKEDSSRTQHTDAEIFANASQKTDFAANASGTFKIGVYDVHADSHVGGDQSAESKNTKRDQRESVIKSAQEYRDQHRLEVTTDETSENEVTSSSEIRNPNDELTVTYLFYELQRRYLVSESLHAATPVILVANDVPAPHEIDEAWLVRYDWILKRVMLDDSFLPALAYLGSEFAGQETALIILEMQVQHQKAIVDQLSRQVMLANQTLNAATTGVTNAEDWSLNDQRNQEYSSFVKGFFDPLGIGKAGSVDDGNSDRARIDFANEALQRAQAKVNDLNSQLRTELTALQAAVDKYTAGATRHYAMEAQIDRLRLHVKDNIIYYMQAIWSHEPADQRYFRLYNIDVPVFEGDGTVTAESVSAQSDTARSTKAFLSAAYKRDKTVTANMPKPALSYDTKKLHQVADIDSLIGFKGNYMMFPLTDFDNYMAWYLIHNYVEFDPTAGLMVSDPDPDSDATPAALEEAMKLIHAQDPASFAANETQFEEAMLRLLSDQAEQMVIVPSDQLYIEALPGTHPILEDFKLIHRALDVKKVQAEVRHAELENLRLAARLASGEYGDPDVEKKIVIEGNTEKVAIQADSA